MIIGSAVTIQTTANTVISAADVTIINPLDVEVISAAPMINISGNIWAYNWQSLETGKAGEYKAIVRATNGVYDSVARYYFFMDGI